MEALFSEVKISFDYQTVLLVFEVGKSRFCKKKPVAVGEKFLFPQLTYYFEGMKHFYNPTTNLTLQDESNDSFTQMRWIYKLFLKDSFTHFFFSEVDLNPSSN